MPFARKSKIFGLHSIPANTTPVLWKTRLLDGFSLIMCFSAAHVSGKIKTTRQTGGLHKGYKPIMPTRVSRRGLSLCSSLRVFAALATPKGIN